MQHAVQLAVGLLAVANAVSAGLEQDLRSLIQSKIELNQADSNLLQVSAEVAAIDCTQGQNLYCPLSSIPDVTFPPEGGSMSSVAGSCCPKNYLQCQVQQNQQYCRVLGYYTITSSTANSEDKCPPTTPDCTCQQSLSGESALRLRFCPSTTPCCPNCECYGDPHCRAFSSSSQIWAICDSRDATCVHNAATCATTTYGGQACTWVPAKTGQPAYCSRAAATTTPTMLMYTKKYKKYFNPADNNEYEFTLVLTLGVYGAISKVDLTDTGTSAQTFSWFIDGNGNCRGNSAYPFNNKGLAAVGDLQSMVTMTLACKTGGHSPTSGRIDVLQLQDPWYTANSPINFGGYCATGIITEASKEPSGTACNTVDRQISMYYGCSPKTDINKCKSNWCQDNYWKLDYSNIVAKGTPIGTIAQKRKQCTTFLTNTNPTQLKNFLAAACATSPTISQGKYPVDPTTCASTADCKACMDNVLDYPDDLATVLSPGDAPTEAPTSPCPNLLAIGLARKQLGTSQSGIQIDFQNTLNVWEPVFALFNEEIESCDCEQIYVNGSAIENRVLVNPGKYRIKQCNGLDTDPDQEMCTSSPAYNTTVVYTNPVVGAVFSQSYGVMFNEKKITCNTIKVYRGCPTDYQCCVWETSKAGWTDCMVGAYGLNFANLYPMCKFPGT